MKKYLIVTSLIIFGIVLLLNPLNQETNSENEVSPKEKSSNKVTPSVGIPNPAAQYCEENGGTLETVVNKDGSQFAICNLGEYSCEEWTYYRDECAIEEDAAMIKQALIDKGLDLTSMKVVIKHHLGKYIGGSVLPISAPAGGGYVFAFKEGDEVKIVADGNGAITCEMLRAYPDYPTFLISECVDESGNLVSR